MPPPPPARPSSLADGYRASPPPDRPPGAAFDALADPTRRRVLEVLADSGPASATVLAPGFGVSRQALVKHLGALAAAGLVSARRQGREVLYAVEPAPLADAAGWLEQVGRTWDRRLVALVKHLGGDGPP